MKEEDLPEFVDVSKELLKSIDYIQKEIYKALAGNKKAARRARVGLIKIECLGRLFRKVSVRL